MAVPYQDEKSLDLEAVVPVSDKDVGIAVNTVSERDGEANSNKYDIAATFLADIAHRPDADDLLSPWSPEEEKQVLKRIDAVIIPCIFFLNLMSGVDKTIIGQAVIFGLKKDLKLTGSEYSWANSIVFVACILMAFPQLWLCQKFPIRYIMSFNVLGYAVCSFATAGVKNAGGLLAVRFVLGWFEAVNHGGCGLVISMWWKKSEQGWRAALSLCVMGSVVNGLLSYALQFYTPAPGALSRWRLLFVILGAWSTITSACLYVFFASSPAAAWWLSDRHKVIAVRRLASNQTGVLNHRFKKEQMIEALIDPKTWLIFATNVMLNIPNGGLQGFNSIIVNSLGYSVKQTTLLAIPSGVISQFSSVFWTKVAQRTRRPMLCCVISICIPLAATIMLTTIPRSNKGASLAALFILYTYWAPYIIMGSVILYANVAGTTKKVVVYGSSYIGYCVGALVGPQAFISSEAPKYPTATTTMLAGYCVSILLVGLYTTVCIMDNRKKERQEAERLAEHTGGSDEVAAEWQDLTDKQNPMFRYTY